MAVFIPTISGYEPFYIHRDSDATATNILTTYGVVVKDSGYPMNRKAKEPYKNDWKDRSGDDEWNTQINYEAFTYELEAAIFIRVTSQVTEATARQQLAAAVRSFEDFIKSGEFKFYSAWHCFGFQKARIDEIATEVYGSLQKIEELTQDVNPIDPFDFLLTLKKEPLIDY